MKITRFIFYALMCTYCHAMEELPDSMHAAFEEEENKQIRQLWHEIDVLWSARRTAPQAVYTLHTNASSDTLYASLIVARQTQKKTPE